MRIVPIVNTEIVGRYRKQANNILDVFTNQVLYTTNNKTKLNNVFKQINTIGLVNAKRLDKDVHAQLLYILA